MSVQDQITRINGEVGTQASLLQQLRTALNGKAVSGGSGDIYPITSAAGYDGIYVDSALGFPGLSVIQVLACSNVYSPEELIGKAYRTVDPVTSEVMDEGVITTNQFMPLESVQNSYVVDSYVVAFSNFAAMFVIHPSDVGVPIGEGWVFPAAGTYLSFLYFDDQGTGVFQEVDIEGQRYVPPETCQAVVNLSAPAMVMFYGSAEAYGEAVPTAFYTPEIYEHMQMLITLEKNSMIIFISLTSTSGFQAFAGTASTTVFYPEATGSGMLACKVTGDCEISIT